LPALLSVIREYNGREMILSNISKSTEYIPTAAGSGPDTLKPFPAKAELRIRDSLPGTGLYALIAGPDETDSLKRHTQAAVCLKACGAGIPFPDPVQTPNGFAVVGNSNQAPAGKE
jgi:hypothetical protein